MNKHEDFTYTLPSGRKYTFDQILKQEFHRQDKASLEGFQKHAINRGMPRPFFFQEISLDIFGEL